MVGVAVVVLAMTVEGGGVGDGSGGWWWCDGSGGWWWKWQWRRVVVVAMAVDEGGGGECLEKWEGMKWWVSGLAKNETNDETIGFYRLFSVHIEYNVNFKCGDGRHSSRFCTLSLLS
ncbi:hypothetical protein L1987_64025 [Smallanthus sonchifolius]|uniref:Uncharacterized protein n=1 Tax=Smallanthus sonchifolius TaxID=185202 RepID=A0ACB9CEY0_9ASTR|nr:hypothetical protein L1987_64025 [Smallanthus sonchifolius]